MTTSGSDNLKTNFFEKTHEFPALQARKGESYRNLLYANELERWGGLIVFQAKLNDFTHSFHERVQILSLSVATSQGRYGGDVIILFVSLEEEEKGGLSTITMAGRARAAFDIERVTKAFYRDFDTHRKAFLKFIDGISEVADREWYASVMLNRLMFVYFIQRKGFLDGDPDYLRNRLHRCQQEQGNVTGRWKTGHSRALQNRPLQGALFIPSFLMQARDYFQVYRIKFGAFITSFASGFRTLIISLSE